MVIHVECSKLYNHYLNHIWVEFYCTTTIFINIVNQILVNCTPDRFYASTKYNYSINKKRIMNVKKIKTNFVNTKLIHISVFISQKELNQVNTMQIMRQHILSIFSVEEY